MGEVDRCRDAQVGLCCVIGATVRLGLAGHELGERESEQRAQNRPGCWGWLGVARVAPFVST